MILKKKLFGASKLMTATVYQCLESEIKLSIDFDENFRQKCEALETFMKVGDKIIKVWRLS